MESSPANRLPEADSLPDGFVESSAEPPAAPDYKDALLDLGPSGESGDGSSLSGVAKTLNLDSVADGLGKLTTSTDFSSQKDVGVEDRISMPKPGNDPSEKSKEMEEISVASSAEESRGDCQSPEEGFNFYPASVFS